MSGYVAECLECTHVRKTVSDALATQEEIVLNALMPRAQRLVVMTMSDKNVFQDFILSFRSAEKVFDFSNLLCLSCTRDEVRARLQASGAASLDLSMDEYIDLDEETAFERVSASGWRRYEDLAQSMNKVVQWGDEEDVF